MLLKRMFVETFLLQLLIYGKKYAKLVHHTNILLLLENLALWKF